MLRGMTVPFRALAVALCAALLGVAGCSGDDAATTTTTAPALTDSVDVQLRVRAMRRACPSCSEQPICVYAGDSPDLVAAIEAAFPEGTMLLTDYMYPHLPVPDCLFLGTFPRLKELPGGILGVDAGGPERWRTFWFRWDGSQWVDITPEEAGVTDTTAVS
jgi:hypothetical protein